jgi:alpha-N-arabinofuranosidase
VNPWPEEKEVRVEIGEQLEIEGQAEVILMTSDSVFDENTFQNPNKVLPKKYDLSGLSNEFTFTFAENSITILRLKAVGL